MFDIYTNRVPFGLLDDAERAALMEHPGPWQTWSHNMEKWYPSDDPAWLEKVIYRAVRAPEEPLWIAPEVWAVLDKKWQWAAWDRTDNRIYVYDSKPKLDSWLWMPTSKCERIGSLFAPHLIRPGTVAWDKSLISRPEGV
jgi:hypothetical protein